MRLRVSRRSWPTALPTSARAGGAAPCALCQPLGLRAGAGEGRLPARHTAQRGAGRATGAACLAGCGCCCLASHGGGGRLPVCHPGPAGQPASQRGRPARREGTGGVLARFWGWSSGSLGAARDELNWQAPGMPSSWLQAMQRRQTCCTVSCTSDGMSAPCKSRTSTAKPKDPSFLAVSCQGTVGLCQHIKRFSTCPK